MKRAQIGDVYAFKTDRGYRIMQWAYFVERKGRYNKIFSGFYEEIPPNLEEIIAGDCAYIIESDTPKLYRKGLLEYLGNYAVSSPFPTMDLTILRVGPNALSYDVAEIEHRNTVWEGIGNSTGDVIPKEYRDIRLLNIWPHPYTFLYLLEEGFDLKHCDLLWRKEEKLPEIERKYGAILFGEDRKKKF